MVFIFDKFCGQKEQQTRLFSQERTVPQEECDEILKAIHIKVDIGIQFWAFLKFADMGDVLGIVEHQTIGFRLVALQQRSKNHPRRTVLVKISVVVQLVIRVETGKFAFIPVTDQVAADLRIICGGVSVENCCALRRIRLQRVQKDRDASKFAAEKIRRFPCAAEIVRYNIQLRFVRIGTRIL